MDETSSSPRGRVFGLDVGRAVIGSDDRCRHCMFSLSSFAAITFKAFVSHATADQDRFVRGLAERLQSNGVDT